MCCKQAELRPDLSYNSSRNRSRPTLPSNPPHTRAWGELWAAGHSPQLPRAQRRERDQREGCWVGEGEWKQGGGWQRVPGISAEPVRETLRLMAREGPQEQIWIYESFKRKVCVRKIKVYVLLKSMRSIGSSALIHTVSWIKPHHAAMSQLQTGNTACKRDSARWVVSKLLLIDLSGAQICRRKNLKALLPSRTKVK